MSDLQTPRDRDDDGLNLDRWSEEIESLLSEFGEVALCYSWLHSYSTRKYKAKYHRMSIPIIVLSTLTGTANFADSYVPVGFKQGFSACVGGLNIFCGILGTLMSFLKYAEIYEAHRIAALDEEHYAAVDAEDRADALARKQKQGLVYKKLKKKKKIPKKSDDADLELDFLE